MCPNSRFETLQIEVLALVGKFWNESLWRPFPLVPNDVDLINEWLWLQKVNILAYKLNWIYLFIEKVNIYKTKDVDNTQKAQPQNESVSSVC